MERLIERLEQKKLDAYYNLNQCGNCGSHVEHLIYLEGWGFSACERCADEAMEQELLEAARKPVASVESNLNEEVA